MYPRKGKIICNMFSRFGDHYQILININIFAECNNSIQYCIHHSNIDFIYYFSKINSFYVQESLYRHYGDDSELIKRFLNVRKKNFEVIVIWMKNEKYPLWQNCICVIKEDKNEKKFILISLKDKKTFLIEQERRGIEECFKPL